MTLIQIQTGVQINPVRQNTSHTEPQSLYTVLHCHSEQQLVLISSLTARKDTQTQKEKEGSVSYPGLAWTGGVGGTTHLPLEPGIILQTDMYTTAPSLHTAKLLHPDRQVHTHNRSTSYYYFSHPHHPNFLFQNF